MGFSLKRMLTPPAAIRKIATALGNVAKKELNSVVSVYTGGVISNATGVAGSLFPAGSSKAPNVAQAKTVAAKASVLPVGLVAKIEAMAGGYGLWIAGGGVLLLLYLIFGRRR